MGCDSGAFAVRSDSLQAAAEELRQVVLAANADGLDLLRRGKGAQAFEQLKYAEAVLTANPAVTATDGGLLALTCSNLGCYYKKAGLPRAALRYLGRAMRAEEAVLLSGVLRRAAAAAAAEGEDGAPPEESELGTLDPPGSAMDVPSLAKTKLNACAALSSVGSHERAEQLAAEAAHLLAPRISMLPSPHRNSSSGSGGATAADAAEAQRKQECGLLAVACHNLGAEREHLGRWVDASVAFTQGAEVAARSHGPGSPLARALATSADEALSKAERHPDLPDRPSPRRPTWGNAAGGGRRPVRGRIALDSGQRSPQSPQSPARGRGPFRAPWAAAAFAASCGSGVGGAAGESLGGVAAAGVSAAPFHSEDRRELLQDFSAGASEARGQQGANLAAPVPGGDVGGVEEEDEPVWSRALSTMSEVMPDMVQPTAGHSPVLPAGALPGAHPGAPWGGQGNEDGGLHLPQAVPGSQPPGSPAQDRPVRRFSNW